MGVRVGLRRGTCKKCFKYLSDIYTEQKEIDYIEEVDGIIHAYEFKWNSKAKYKTPKQFLENYMNSCFSMVTPDNVEEFLL